MLFPPIESSGFNIRQDKYCAVFSFYFVPGLTCYACFLFGQIFVNNSFALDSTWVYPEESRLFHGHQKPQLWRNQVAVSLSRPAPASRPLPTVVLAPQPPPGWCPDGSDNVRLVFCLFAQFSYRLVLGMKTIFVILMTQFFQ